MEKVCQIKLDRVGFIFCNCSAGRTSDKINFRLLVSRDTGRLDCMEGEGVVLMVMIEKGRCTGEQAVIVASRGENDEGRTGNVPPDRVWLVKRIETPNLQRTKNCCWLGKSLDG